MAALAVVFALAVSAQAQKKVAVYPFDDRTNNRKDPNLGTKIADALVSKLANDGAFTVVDRQYLERIAAEKNLKLSDDFDAKTAPKSGLLGVVDILIVGQIDAFEASSSSKTNNSFFKGTETDGDTALRVTVRMISVERGAILAAPAAKSQQSAILAQQSSMTIKGKAIPIANSNVNIDAALQKLVDKEIDDVASQLAKSIAASANNVGGAPAGPIAGKSSIELNGLKAKCLGLDDGAALINKGTKAGVKIGDKFSLSHATTTTLKDDEGKPVVRHKKVCELVIDSVEETTAAGKCTGGTPEAGDEATLVP